MDTTDKPTLPNLLIFIKYITRITYCIVNKCVFIVYIVLLFGRHVSYEVDDAVGVAELVVVPGD